MGTHPIFESDFDCLTELNLRVMKNESVKMDDDVYNKVSMLGENKINRLNQILSKLNSPVKGADPCEKNTGLSFMTSPLNNGMQALMSQVNAINGTDFRVKQEMTLENNTVNVAPPIISPL